MQNYCRNNSIAYNVNFFGNDYFNDNFRIIGYIIEIDFLNTSYNEAVQKNSDFLKFIKKQKELTFERIDTCYSCNFLYRVFTKSDFLALQEHEKRRKEATENFNNWYHYFCVNYPGCKIYS